MRVELSTDGGFAAMPGLAKPIVLDTAHGSQDQMARLKTLVDAAEAENAHRIPTKATQVPDARHYRVSIQRDGERHELEADDPTVPPALNALIDFIRANGQR